MIETPAKPVLLGLLGSPIRHSAAPRMHEAAGACCGLRVHYQLIDVADASAATLRMLLDSIRMIGFAGINVTFPYKEAVLPLLDSLDDTARAVGAVNTITIRDGRLYGHNTDTTGFEKALREEITRIGHGPVALIGAGGVGRAVGFALARLGIREIRIVDRDAAKAASLVRDLGTSCRALACADAESACDAAEGVVNATPVGMLPSTALPIPANLLRREQWVADVVYYPLVTPFLAAARQIGATTATGRAMTVHQAADAFHHFTGITPPLPPIQEAFDAVIAARAG